MTIPWLLDEQPLPSPHEANEDGIVAVGGRLSKERLLEAYSKGIFPWPHEDLPMLWFSPDPRFVIPISRARIPRSLLKELKKTSWKVTLNQDFENVILQCALTERPDQGGTWITSNMAHHYLALHDAGYAHSVEIWEDRTLIGGLYGVSLGGCFFGESMFALRSDASKLAFATFMAQLSVWDFDLIDCQVHTDHLARFGAIFWERQTYCQHIQRSQKNKKSPHNWIMSMQPKDAYEFFKQKSKSAS